MTKHRFIFSGLVSGEDKVSDYRLIRSVRRYSLGQCVCVNIPDDMEINHYPGDGYSTVDDDRTLDELGWDCYFLYKGRWRKFNELKKYKPCEWSDVLEYIYVVCMSVMIKLVGLMMRKYGKSIGMKEISNQRKRCTFRDLRKIRWD